MSVNVSNVGRGRSNTDATQKPLPEWTAAELRQARANDWRALLFDFALRGRGYSLSERADLVAERYPHTRERLQPLIDGPAREEGSPLDPLAGQAKTKAAGA